MRVLLFIFSFLTINLFMDAGMAAFRQNGGSPPQNNGSCPDLTKEVNNSIWWMLETKKQPILEFRPIQLNWSKMDNDSGETICSYKDGGRVLFIINVGKVEKQDTKKMQK